LFLVHIMEVSLLLIVGGDIKISLDINLQKNKKKEIK